MPTDPVYRETQDTRRRTTIDPISAWTSGICMGMALANAFPFPHPTLSAGVVDLAIALMTLLFAKYGVYGWRG